MARIDKIAIPGTAILLAGGYLVAALALPALLPVIAGGAALAACALVLTRRRTGGLAGVMLGIASWLAVGFAGAWLLRAAPVAGLGWILLILFLLPLPFIPWLYARSFTLPAGSHQDGEQ
ncbi:MAG: hypothetical protein HRF46_07605 [Acidobacteriota bacterium]|jgi:hypothetical protein